MGEAIIEFFATLPKEIYVFVISLLPIIELRGAIPVGAAIGLPFYSNYILAVLGNILPVPFILFFISEMLNLMAKVPVFRPVVNWIREKADKHSSKVIKDEPISKDTEVAEPSSKINEESCIDETSEEAHSNEELPCNHKDADALPSVSEDGQSSITEAPYDGDQKSEYKPRKMTTAIFTALMLFVAIPLPGTGAWTGSLIAALFCLPKRWAMLSITLGVLISGVIMCLASYSVFGFLSFLI